MHQITYLHSEDMHVLTPYSTKSCEGNCVPVQTHEQEEGSTFKWICVEPPVELAPDCLMLTCCYCVCGM